MESHPVSRREKGTGGATTIKGLSTRVGVPNFDGFDLSVDNPPPACDYAASEPDPCVAPWINAVRFAVGELVVGDEYFAEISLKVLKSPLDPKLGDANCAEIFGGAGSATKIDKDNTWRCFVPAPNCVLLNLLFDLDVSAIMALPLDLLDYPITAKNLSTDSQFGVQVTDEYDPLVINIIDTIPNFESNVNGVITWPAITEWLPGAEDVYLIQAEVFAGASGPPLHHANYASQSPARTFRTVALTNLDPITLRSLELDAAPDNTSPGGSVSHQATLTNTGNADAVSISYAVSLPTDFTITGQRHINGANVDPPDLVDGAYVFTDGVLDIAASGGVVVIDFTATVGGGVAPCMYTSCIET